MCVLRPTRGPRDRRGRAGERLGDVRRRGSQADNLSVPRGPGPSRLLIVNADDFGLSSGVNEGVIEAHERGVVTSASLMVDAPGAEEAAGLTHARPDLGVGLHFVAPERADLDDPAQAASAFAVQLERFRALVGADPTHVDSHHHVHTEGSRMATFSRLVSPLGLPLRHDGRVPYIGGFYAQREPGVTELRHVGRRSLVELVRTEALGGFAELACHPARITGDFSSSYLREREVELRTLTEPGLAEELEALGTRLVNFREWARQDGSASLEARRRGSH